MKIFIGITTFDRPEYLSKCVKSLYASEGIQDEAVSIHIFDDCSPHWDQAYLSALFPGATSILRNSRNMGSDENIRKMFLHFLESEADVLAAVDSDLIFHPGWLSFIRQHLGTTDGILSLYNSSCHPVIWTDGIFVQKEHIGSAGVVMQRKIVQSIIEQVPESSYYDWDWSRYLLSQGFRIMVSARSYVQHLGMYGYNNLGKYADYGLGFLSGSEFNETCNIELFQDLLQFHMEELRKLEDKESHPIVSDHHGGIFA